MLVETEEQPETQTLSGYECIKAKNPGNHGRHINKTKRTKSMKDGVVGQHC